MEPLRLKPRLPVEDDIENWDDDDFLVDADDLTFRSVPTSNIPPRPSSRRRDSGSSHFSFRSDLESLPGEEKHVHIGDDEKSTLDAITAAQHAGIPLPKNVPPSALMGGTIKRLGGRRLKKIIQEDWENDLELPDMSQGLTIKKHDQTEFPDTLRQVSAGSSPTRTTKSPSIIRDDRRESIQSTQSTQSTISVLSAAFSLDKFKDTEDDDDFFGDGYETIKVSKSRLPPKSVITPPTPQKDGSIGDLEDDFELDLELPSDGKLKLTTRREIPKTPSSQSDDLDWGEGSLGTRFGGTRRSARSNRSSSASALSPSISSSITAESEDETFEGLVLPAGPVNFSERLQLRRKSRSPQRISEEPLVRPQDKPAPPADADKQDFLEGLDIGDGEVFDSSKLTLHRNVKVKETRPASPARPKAAVSLKFTNKPINAPVSTRIPRLHHERQHSTSLEPVSESGGPIPARNRRSQSRLSHSAQSSISSLPTPTTPSASQVLTPATPRRRELGLRTSTSSLRIEPTTTSAQLLKQKRSLPAIRAVNSPAKPPVYRYERPSSRSENNRPLSGTRPKTPVERQRPATTTTDSPAGTVRKSQLPFLPAGASQSQSQHVTSKNGRHFRRHDSDNSIDLRPNSRTFSRTAMRSPSPHRYKVAADTWERLSKPKNKKNFGDGHELDAFDDLPTSKESETKYLKQPITTGPKTAMRNKLYQNVLPDRTTTPAPQTPRPSYTPHFARDTAASRIARETALAQRVPSSGMLPPSNSAQRLPQAPSRTALNPQPNPPQSTVRSKKHSKRSQQLKPHLISNLNSGKESKMVNGMFYNAETYCWEGNENALNVFEPPQPIVTPGSAAANTAREKEVSTPRPALITNISATKGIQVVGGMVFDPENMCWLKIDPPSRSKSETSDTMEGFDALDEEEDVFKDIPDLEENTADDDGAQGRVSEIKDDWLVGEEFDVGPEFIRRQREEEERWRKKCEKWVGRGPRDREAWRWTIRELVSQFDELAM